MCVQLETKESYQVLCTAYFTATFLFDGILLCDGLSPELVCHVANMTSPVPIPPKVLQPCVWERRILEHYLCKI